MPQFMIVLILNINLLNLSWIKKKSHTIFEEYEAFSFDVLFAIVFVFGCRKNCI